MGRISSCRSRSRGGRSLGRSLVIPGRSAEPAGHATALSAAAEVSEQGHWEPLGLVDGSAETSSHPLRQPLGFLLLNPERQP